MNFTSEAEAIAAAKETLRSRISSLDTDLVKLPDRLTKIISEYSKQYDATAFELSGAVSREVDIHRETLYCLRQASSMKLLDPLKNLVELAPETSTLTQQHLVAQANIQTTLNVLEPFVNLEQSIADLRKQLTQPNELSSVVNRGLKLAEHKNKILEHASEQTRPQLEEFFKPLTEFEAELRNVVWSVIENCVEVAQHEPKALVRSLKIILKVEDEPEAKVKAAIQEKVTARLTNKLTNTSIEALAGHTHEAIRELAVIRDKVLDCFPRDYDMRSFFIQVYRNVIEGSINPIVENTETFAESPGNLVLIFQWISEYSAAIEEFCPSAIEDYNIQLLLSKVKELLPNFIQHMEDILSKCIHNAEKLHVTEGRLQEMANAEEVLSDTFPEEIFTAINYQLGFIDNRLQGEVLIEAIKVSRNRLLSLQKRKMEELEERLKADDTENELAWVCLIINNAQRSATHTMELMQKCQRYFYDKETYQERIRSIFEAVQKGFIEICNQGSKTLAWLVCKMVCQETIEPLFTPDWTRTDFVINALTTMADFGISIRNWLASDLYARRYKRFFIESYLGAYFERQVQVFSKLNQTKYLPQVLPVLAAGPVGKLTKKELTTILQHELLSGMQRDKEHFLELLRTEGIDMPVEEMFEHVVHLKYASGNATTVAAMLQLIVGNPNELANALGQALRLKV